MCLALFERQYRQDLLLVSYSIHENIRVNILYHIDVSILDYARPLNVAAKAHHEVHTTSIRKLTAKALGVDGFNCRRGITRPYTTTVYAPIFGRDVDRTSQAVRTHRCLILRSAWIQTWADDPNQRKKPPPRDQSCQVLGTCATTSQTRSQLLPHVHGSTIPLRLTMLGII
jgi:hypothetical protein